MRQICLATFFAFATASCGLSSDSAPPLQSTSAAIMQDGNAAVRQSPPGTAAASSGTDSERSGPHCAGADFADHDGPKARDALCLRELAQSANRSGDILTLRLENGAVKTFRSNPAACRNDDASACVDYRLVGYHASARLFLVRAKGYEGYDCRLVSARDGTTTKIADVPHFSPDGSTFIVIGNDITGVRDYDLAVGSIATDPPALTWRRRPNDNEEWHFKRWLDNEHVALNCFRGRAVGGIGGACEAVLARADNKWTLQLAAAK
jgi:hypothetical protein